MNRRPFIAGNWKMNLSRETFKPLVNALCELATSIPETEIGVFPPSLYIPEIIEKVQGAISVGGQDIYHEKSGAFTGQIAADMLRDVNATYVLIGHSERRHVFGETNADTALKVKAALDAGLRPVLCVGELLAEREAGQTVDVVKKQIDEGLAGLDSARLADLVIAYEPVWAIGTGVTATTEQAGEVHAEVRQILAALFGDEFAQSIRILYGGSVKPGNVDELMAVPEIDGVLVGGASLTADSFTRIADFKQLS